MFSDAPYMNLLMAGQPPYFNSPDELAVKAVQYLKWCEDNPLKEDGIYGAKNPENMDVDKMRIPTIFGLCGFCNMSYSTLLNYEAKPEYLPVISRIKETIFTIKLEAASAGLANPNIIARDLGLVDKKEVKSEKTQKVILYTPDNGRKIDAPTPKPFQINGEVLKVEEKSRWDDLSL